MMTVGQPQAMIEMVASGFGISAFPRWAVYNHLEANGLVTRPITRSGLTLTWKAMFLKNRQLPVFQQEFINTVRRVNNGNASHSTTAV